MAELLRPGVTEDSDYSNSSRYIIKKLLCSFFSSRLIFNPKHVTELFHARYYSRILWNYAAVFVYS